MRRSWGSRGRVGLICGAAVALIVGSLATLTPAGASPGACGFTGDVNVFTANGAASGSYSDPAMWDGAAVPAGGQACIPAGKTALVPTGQSSLPDSLKVQGTLRAAEAGAVLARGNPAVEITGRVEVPAGTSLNVYFGGTMTLAVGGVIRVEGGGSFLTQMPVGNLGGTVDLSGAGAFTVYGGYGRFIQGASGGATPTQGTVVGGRVSMVNGTTLDVRGTGAGAFDWPPGSQAILSGALAASQSVDVACDRDDGNGPVLLQIASAVTNAGTIRLNPRLGGTTCETRMTIATGASLTNRGQLVLGGAARPTDQVILSGGGSLVNAPEGTITTAGAASNQLASLQTDGTFTVAAAGSFGQGGNGVFELRDGTLSNQGAFSVGGGFTFRELLGVATGAPIIMAGGRLELLGPGAAAFLVQPNGGATLQNTTGPSVIYPRQSITVDDGSFAIAGPTENRGLITLTGAPDGQANFGTRGETLTNRGRIVFTSRPGTGSGGVGMLGAQVVNETDGVMEAQPGRPCSLGLGSVLNRGLIDLRQSCYVSGPTTLADTSVLRVRSSATSLTTVSNFTTGSTLGGTLDVVTDQADPPPAGPPRDLLSTYPRHTLDGTFTALRGAVSSSLGYALVYPSNRTQPVQLQVVPLVQTVAVTDVTAPTSGAVGDDLTVSWTTTLGAASSTPFTDSVLLADGPVPDSSAVLLGRVQHTETAAAGEPRPSSLSVRLPPAALGRRFLVVVGDSGRALASRDRNGASAAVPVDLDATPLPVGGSALGVTVGADGSRSTGSGTAVLTGTRLLRLTGGAGDVAVTVTPPTAVVALAANGRVPTEADQDSRAVGGRLLLPATAAGTPRLVLLRNTSADPVTVTVTADAPGVSIASVAPAAVVAGSPADTPVRVRGTGFTRASVARLVCGATSVSPVSTQVDSSTSLTSVFALPTALGACDVVVGTATKSGAFTVTAPPAQVDLSVVMPRIDVVSPGVVRTGVDNRITVRWTNDTGFSLPAPLFEVSVDVGALRFPGSPANGSRRVDVLGVSPDGPAGLLPPGATGSTDLIVRGVAAHQRVNYFTAGIRAGDAFDLGDALTVFLPETVSDAARTWVANNGPPMLGVPRLTTVAGLQKHLGSVASQLSALGRRVPDVARLLSVDVARITADNRLAGFASGEFGVGQAGLALPRLSVEAATTDVLITNGLVRLRFARQANGSYVSPPASGDRLVAGSSGWSLVARDGTRRTFSSAGLLVSITDPALRVTTFEYAGSRLTAIRPPGGQTTSYSYDAGGRIVSETDALGRVATYAYDPGGRLVSSTDRGLTTTSTWNADNLVVGFQLPGQQPVTLTRDVYGRLTETRVGTTVRATYAFGGDGSLTASNSLGQAATTWTDDTGAVAKVVDSAGRTTTVRRDAAGAPVGLLADGLPIGDSVLTDAAGRVSGTVDGAGRTTGLAFGVDGLLAAVTDPAGRRTTITRNASLQPTAVTDPAGRTASATYDSAGRLATLTSRNGGTSTLGYGPNDVVNQQAISGFGTISYAYDARRNLTSATGPAGATTFGWDGNDRLTSVSYPNRLGLTYGYDRFGRLTTTTTSDGRVTTRAYDADGRLASIAGAAGVLSRYSYDDLGQPTAVANSNGSRTEITRNVLGLVTRQRTTCCTAGGASEGSNVVSDVQLTYDDRDRVLTRTDAAGVTTYTYDAAGRLSGAATTGASPRTISYTYDSAGNRTSSVDSVTGTTTSTVGADGRPTAVGADAISYDATGRMTGKGADTYSWDSRGALQSVTAGGATTTYTYDALGVPLTRTTGGVSTKLLVDPTGTGSLVGEYASDGTPQAGYAWGRGLAARTNGAGVATSFYATDARGDVVALTDAAGAVTDTYRYLPFGEVVGGTGSTGQPFQFEGGWGLRTEPTGLVTTQARTYNPSLGRFLSEDPELFDAANPATFVSSDPMNRVDAGGTAESFLTTAAAGAYEIGLTGLGFTPDTTNPGDNVANGAGLAASMFESALGNVAKNNLAQAAENLGQSQVLNTLARNLKGTDNAAKLMKARDALDATRKGLYAEAESAQRLSKGFKALGPLLNIYQGAVAFEKDPTFANGVRQVSKAFLKSVAPPLIGLAFDTLETGVDQGSQAVFERIFGVDPITQAGPDAPNSHWNAKNRRPPRPAGGADGGDSSDPNAIVGPLGATVGTTRFVAGSAPLPYLIQFENLPTATLPANQVVVTQTLDPSLDLRTFALGTLGIGADQWAAPAGSRSWSTMVDDRAQSGFFIRVQARLDLGTRELSWTLTGVDPVTGDQPTDATRGFLPPDRTAPEGEGFVTYTVSALPSVRTGDSIGAQASIVFDANPAIPTNTDTVVLDVDAPTAAPSVPATSSNPVRVALGLADAGSGVGTVDVLVSRDDGAFTEAATGAPATDYAFTGVVGSSYRFRVRPTDLVGNEGTLSEPSGSVRVVEAPPPGPPSEPPGPPTPTSTPAPTPTASASVSSSPSPSPSSTAGPARKPLTLTAPKTSVLAGSRSTVVATGAAGQAYELRCYTRPSTQYATARAGAFDAVGDPVVFTLSLSRNTRCFIRYTLDPLQGASNSVVLQVRTALSLSSVRTGPRRYVFQGRNLPRIAGQRITLYRVDPAGKEIRTSTLLTDASGTFRIVRTFAASGRFPFRVRTSQTLNNAAGVSNTIRADVR